MNLIYNLIKKALHLYYIVSRGVVESNSYKLAC